MPLQEPNPQTKIKRLRAQAFDAKERAQRWDGTIGLDWRRIANIYDTLADCMEYWSKVHVGAPEVRCGPLPQGVQAAV
jgi:hypothetical protein